MYRVMKYYTTDGVMRFLVLKSDTADRSPVCHMILPTKGGEQPSKLKVIGNMPRTLGRREFP